MGGLAGILTGVSCLASSHGRIHEPELTTQRRNLL